MFGLLSRSDLFRDMAGLAGTQENAAAALQAALNTAQFFGGKAADLAMQGRMARDIDKSMRAIQNARSAGLLSDEQARELSQSAIRGMIGEARPAGAQPLTKEPDVQKLLQGAASGRSGDVSIYRNGETVDIKRPGSSSSTAATGTVTGDEKAAPGSEGSGPGAVGAMGTFAQWVADAAKGGIKEQAVETLLAKAKEWNLPLTKAGAEAIWDAVGWRDALKLRDKDVSPNEKLKILKKATQSAIANAKDEKLKKELEKLIVEVDKKVASPP